MDDNQDKNVNSSTESSPSASSVTPPDPFIATEPPRRKRKLVWISILIIVIVAIGAGCAYYISANKLQPQTTRQNADTNFGTTLDPQALVYVSATQKEEVADCRRSTDTVHYVNLNDAKVNNAITLDDYQGVVEFAVFHDSVALVTAPSCASKQGPSIWLSQDSGKTYKNIYTTDRTTNITSLVFSTDGTEIAFGYATKNADIKAVKAITVASADERELFSDDQTNKFNVFYDIKAYDRKNQRVYYTESCPLCDRAGPEKLQLYDLRNDKSSVAIDENDIGYLADINADATRAVYVSVDHNEGSQLVQFTVNEFDLSTKKRVNFAAHTGSTSEGFMRAGYAIDGAVYYTAGKRVMLIKESGETSELARLSNDATEIYHVGKAHVVYRIDNQSGGEVFDHHVKSDNSMRLLKYEYPTLSLGVSYSIVK